MKAILAIGLVVVVALVLLVVFAPSPVQRIYCDIRPLDAGPTWSPGPEWREQGPGCYEYVGPGTHF